MELNKEEIKEILPQREPFLFLDSALIEEGKATGYYKVTGEEWFFKGHFPGDPIMPGTLILEGLMQAGSLLILMENKGKKALAIGADKVKFRIPVRPGDQLIFIAEAESSFKGKKWGKMIGKAFVKGKVVCEGRISCVIE